MITRTSFGRSILTSIFTTALDFGTLTGLVELFGVNYVVATFLGTVVGFLANFTINRVWAFAATASPMHWQFVRVLPVQGGSTGLQTLGVWLFTRFVGFQYMASKIVVSALVYLGWNYPMNRFWVFRRKIEGDRVPARSAGA
jgi:putative flippase GtrA